MSYPQHVAAAHEIQARCAVVTLSDTRTPETDASGKKLRALLEGDRHAVVDYQVLKDDAEIFEVALAALVAREDVDAILTNGGTGISRRDQTIDVVERALDRPLPGFGELFRLLSWDQIGSGAMLSRATAGVARGKLIFALPGSTKAVELAMVKLILPELRHLIFELRK